LRDSNEESEGLFNEWLKLWQIREEQAEQATDSETEQEVPNHGPSQFYVSCYAIFSIKLIIFVSKQDESHGNEEDGRTHEDEETSENEVAQQDDSGSNN